MRKIITEKYVRITKKQAAARYQTKQDVYILPCKMHPENFYMHPLKVNKKHDPELTFEKLLNSFEFYNCNYETGYYAAFYITRKEYDERKNNF